MCGRQLGAAPSGSTPPEKEPDSSRFFQVFLGLWRHHSNLCLHRHLAFSVSSSASQKDACHWS